MQNKGFFSQDQKQIEKLFIQYLREEYIPMFKKELGENCDEREVEKLFKNFVEQIKSTNLMQKMLETFYKNQLNQKTPVSNSMKN